MGGVWPRRRGAYALALGLLALACALGAPAGPADAAPLGRACPSDPGDRSRCLRVVVPLDRSGALPGTVSLLVRVLPPVTPTPSETILALAGGPGQAAVPLLPDIAASLGGNLLRARQLVTFDQRGTGGSGRLTCPSLGAVGADAAPEGPVVQNAVAACAAHIGRADGDYASADSVADVEAVREALGVERLTLYGTSYGTKVALDYAAAYPQHVDRLLLDSVVAPAGVDPFERLTIGSIPRVVRSLCGRRRCPFTHDAAADVDALAARLARGPLRGRWIDPYGHPRTAAMSQSDLFSLLLDGDLDPFERAALPAAVRAAVNGDAMPILRLARAPGDSLDASSGDSDALSLAATCDDGAVPWAPGTPISDRGAAVADALAAIPVAQLAPFGPDGVRQLGDADLCRGWPTAPVPQPHAALPDVPTLILSGDQDLRTPRAAALQLAARIPGARVLRVPAVGHSVLGADVSGCADQAVTAFFEMRPVSDCRAAALLVPPYPLAPASLRDVPAVPGLPSRVGRTLTASVGTFVVALRALLLEALPQILSFRGPHGAVRIGGLRGGSIALGEDALRMERYSYVPGVTVSMALPLGGGRRLASLRLSIGGAAAARGWIRIGRARIVGRLGGHRVDVDRRRVVSSAAVGSIATARAARASIRTIAPAVRELPPLARRLLALGASVRWPTWATR